MGRKRGKEAWAHVHSNVDDIHPAGRETSMGVCVLEGKWGVRLEVPDA